MSNPSRTGVPYNRQTGSAASINGQLRSPSAAPGPFSDYPVKWTYERAGLPVVVIRETNDWRKIRDPMSDEVWVAKSQLTEQRTAITTHAGAIRKDPKAEAPLAARFHPGAVVTLGQCGNAWCQVSAQGQRGWIVREHLWGVDALPSAAGNN